MAHIAGAAMNRFIAVILLISIAHTFGASARPAERLPDPAKQAAAEAMIAKTNSQGVWRSDDTGKITLIQSGMDCSVTTEGDLFQLTGLTVYQNAENGADVSCNYALKLDHGSGTMTVYAFKANGRPNEQLLGEAVGQAKAVHPDWTLIGKPKLNIGMNGKGEGKIQPLSALFEFGTSPKMYSAIWVAASGEWAVMVRTTYPEADAMLAETMSIVSWAYASLKIEDGGKR